MIVACLAWNKYREEILIECLKSVIITKSMKQSFSWEANSSSDSQEIPRTLLNTTVHYRVHNSLPGVSPYPEPEQTSPRLTNWIPYDPF
jgi:hypothetical protein